MNLYIKAPIIALVVIFNILLFLNTVSPTIIEAIATTIIPVPIDISEKPWYCAIKAPLNDTNPFESINPINLYLF